MKQNFISELYFKKSDLIKRVDKILGVIKQETDFLPEKIIQKSSWWNSKHIGAIHYAGFWKNKPAILKIQGVKPKTSEVEMINSFQQQNKSLIIRSPEIYAVIPWNETLEFEAFVMEGARGEKVSEIDDFFDLYKEYRANCLNQPWIDKPEISLAEQTQNNFEKWKKISAELHPNHPLKKPGDLEIVNKGVSVLTEKLKDVDWQFQHGHFSLKDLNTVENNQVILLSNLYWSWRMPFYDAVFGFHWHQYDLASSSDVSLSELLLERESWKKYIRENIPQNEAELNLLNLAFLERAIAGINLDGLISPSDKSEALMEILRKEILDFT